jgi:hypothetical protein
MKAVSAKITRKTAVLLVCAVGVPAAILWAMGIQAGRVWLKNKSATSQANGCVVNIRTIVGAKFEWARGNHANSDTTPTWDELRPYMGRQMRPWPPLCPSGGTYTIGRVCDMVACSIPGHEYELGPTEVTVTDTGFRQLSGARVEVWDESGRRVKGWTSVNGCAILSTWPKRAVSVTVSMKGYRGITNTFAGSPFPYLNVSLERDSK